MASLLALVAQTLDTFLSIYFVLLILRILLSWFPNVDWFSPPFSVLSQLTDPYLNIFRSIIPPIGGIDFFGNFGHLPTAVCQLTDCSSA